VIYSCGVLFGFGGLFVVFFFPPKGQWSC